MLINIHCGYSSESVLYSCLKLHFLSKFKERYSDMNIKLSDFLKMQSIFSARSCLKVTNYSIGNININIY